MLSGLEKDAIFHEHALDWMNKIRISNRNKVCQKEDPFSFPLFPKFVLKKVSVFQMEVWGKSTVHCVFNIFWRKTMVLNI